MNCISISHRLAASKVRERFAFDADEAVTFLKNIIKTHKSISQGVLLSTCNRMEIYFDGDKRVYKSVILSLCEHKMTDYSHVLKYINLYQDEACIRHIIKVACGVDSMVLGEDDILHQMKDAYAMSHRELLTGYEINTVFQMAFEAAKDIKTRTHISQMPVSVATLAANEALTYKKQRDNINVLIIGATGKTGIAVAKNLSVKDGITLYGTYRTHLANTHNIHPIQIEGMKSIKYIKRYEAISDADVIISATSSPHYTITKEEFLSEISLDKERLFIDLAVPGDIDEAIGELDKCRLISIDYFSKLAKENNKKKESLAKKADKDADLWADEIAKELKLHALIEHLPLIKSAVEDKGVDKLIYSLRKLADKQTLELVSDWLLKFAGYSDDQ